MQVKIRRMNHKVHFEASNADGNTVQLDGSPAIGGEGKGMRPMELLLTAVASCSVFDVVSILEKQRQPADDVQIEASGERAETGDAKPFTSLHFRFLLTGDLDREKAERAVQLSVEKYCSVGASLDPGIPVTWETVITKR
jgi:putative redox protein